jgi:hypothetical protein
MKCINCEHYQDTCVLEKIYAYGHLRNCPFIGKPEPIIPTTGGNLQVMIERIRKPGGLERIDIVPIWDSENKEYYSHVFLCYGGKGIETDGSDDQSVADGAIFFGWQQALKRIKELKIRALESLIPLIECRLQFDYSVVEYIPLKQEASLIPPVMVEKQKEKKRPGLVRSATEEKLRSVETSSNGEKSNGDQLDLFAC